jgi:hypothetical protein
MKVALDAARGEKIEAIDDDAHAETVKDARTQAKAKGPEVFDNLLDDFKQQIDLMQAERMARLRLAVQEQIKAVNPHGSGHEALVAMRSETPKKFAPTSADSTKQATQPQKQVPPQQYTMGQKIGLPNIYPSYPRSPRRCILAYDSRCKIRAHYPPTLSGLHWTQDEQMRRQYQHQQEMMMMQALTYQLARRAYLLQPGPRPLPDKEEWIRLWLESHSLDALKELNKRVAAVAGYPLDAMPRSDDGKLRLFTQAEYATMLRASHNERPTTSLKYADRVSRRPQYLSPGSTTVDKSSQTHPAIRAPTSVTGLPSPPQTRSASSLSSSPSTTSALALPIIPSAPDSQPFHGTSPPTFNPAPLTPLFLQPQGSPAYNPFSPTTTPPPAPTMSSSPIQATNNSLPPPGSRSIPLSRTPSERDMLLPEPHQTRSDDRDSVDHGITVIDELLDTAPPPPPSFTPSNLPPYSKRATYFDILSRIEDGNGYGTDNAGGKLEHNSHYPSSATSNSHNDGGSRCGLWLSTNESRVVICKVLVVVSVMLLVGGIGVLWVGSDEMCRVVMGLRWDL